MRSANSSPGEREAPIVLPQQTFSFAMNMCLGSRTVGGFEALASAPTYLRECSFLKRTAEAAESGQASKIPFEPARLCFLWLSAAGYYAMDAAHATWQIFGLATAQTFLHSPVHSAFGCACCEILTRTSATYSQSENATSLLQRHLPANEVDSGLPTDELKLLCNMCGGLGGSAFPPWTTSFFESSPGVLAFQLLVCFLS